MTPRTPAHLVAAWVALEDCVPESGGFWIRHSHQPIPGSINARMRNRAGRVARRVRGLLAGK